MSHWIHSILSQTTDAISTRDLVEVAVAALLTVLVYLIFRRYPAQSARTAAWFSASASRAELYILAAMLLPLVLRLVLLPWVPPPEPHAHDEFGHLLIADTLAAGRLANPPHVLWRHFEAIYVLQQPTYSSIYPIGQGIILAVGKVLMGNYWAGVLLSVALMCGAISWMLFGCLPPKWAALGGLLAALNYGLAPQWVNSYWGGAFSAFGGALLFGALCRLWKSPSRTMALLVGLGWSIVWLTRPFESLLPLVISWGLIIASTIRDPRRWKRWLGPMALILSIQIPAVCIAALHNRAVTGSFTTLPYQLSQQAYGVPQSLIWQRPIEEPALRFVELKEMYSWQRELKERSIKQPFRTWGAALYNAWSFFVTPWYSLPIVLLAFLLKDRWVMVAGGMLACTLAASVVYPFFYPHYMAAYSCVMIFLILRGMIALSQWSFRGTAVGPPVVLFLILGGVMMGLRIVPPRAILGLSHYTRQASFRMQVSNRLMRFGGRHVVFVRYDANHTFHDEWVYNAPNIDDAPIVWCRASDPADDSEVTQYYKGRYFWIAYVSPDRVQMSRYQPEVKLNVSTSSSEGVKGDWVLERQPRRQ